MVFHKSPSRSTDFSARPSDPCGCPVHPTMSKSNQSPTEHSIQMKPSQISSPRAGQKRQRTPSPPDTDRKRALLPADSASTLTSPKPLKAEDNWHCPNCGLPCWRCYSSSGVPPDLPSLHVTDESEIARMSSGTPSSATESTTTTPSRKKRKQYEELGTKYVGPRDANFELCILIPCGLGPDTCVPAGLSPNDIFGSQTQIPASRVFIRKDIKDLREIMQDFEEHFKRKYDEHTLSTICNDSVILRDRFVSKILFGGSPPVIVSVRRDKWKPHKEGPAIPGHAYTYDWDMEPDATYAVSINMFDVEHRRELSLETWQHWLAEGSSGCPYLTVEYKCSEKTGKGSHATNQTAAASILWLHQRKQIRDALNLSLVDLRHYSITILDFTYAISEARFRDSSYHIYKLATGLLTDLDGLKRYIEWSNAIHAWGLGPNATSFKEDIETLIKVKQGTLVLPTPPGTLSPTGPTAERSD